VEWLRRQFGYGRREEKGDAMTRSGQTVVTFIGIKAQEGIFLWAYDILGRRTPYVAVGGVIKKGDLIYQVADRVVGEVVGFAPNTWPLVQWWHGAYKGTAESENQKLAPEPVQTVRWDHYLVKASAVLPAQLTVVDEHGRIFDVPCWIEEISELKWGDSILLEEEDAVSKYHGCDRTLLFSTVTSVADGVVKVEGVETDQSVLVSPDLESPPKIGDAVLLDASGTVLVKLLKQGKKLNEDLESVFSGGILVNIPGLAELRGHS
jgi:hypothetical protein